MHTWHWKTWQDHPYLTCSLLEDFQHGFFTHHFGSKQPEALVRILHQTAATYRVKQVHGGTVLGPSELPAPSLEVSESIEAPNLSEADGLLTEQAEQAVWVCTADCTPVLIADVATGHVAAIHAGWRGTAAAIVPAAIARLQSQGSQLSDLRIALGPAIAGAVYQVSTTVAAEVGATIVKQVKQPVGTGESSSSSPETILATLEVLPNPPILPDELPGKVRLDVRRVNALQLEQMGIHPDQVAIAPYCTYQTPEHFFSYRRERLKKAQWSGIVSR
jgi:YfiH family protein